MSSNNFRNRMDNIIDNLEKLRIVDSNEKCDVSKNDIYNSYEKSLRFSTLREYKSHILTVIENEHITDIHSRNLMTQHNVKIKWDLEDKHIVRFHYKHVKNSELEDNINVGDMIKLIKDGNTDQFYIVKIQEIKSNSFTAENNKKSLRNLSSLSSHVDGFTIEYPINMVIYKRRIDAINNFCSSEDNEYIDRFLVSKIIGSECLIDQNLNKDDKITESNLLIAPKLPILDSEQKNAVIGALNNKLHLIHGPPGTGKTITLVSIVYNLLKLRIKSQVLVVAASNKAVDNLAIRIHKNDIKTIRVYSKRQRDLGNIIPEISFDNIADFIAQKTNDQFFNDPKYEKLRQLKLIYGQNMMINYIKNNILKTAQVICCPCTELGNKIFNNMKFDHVLFDEATQALEADSLIAITKNCQNLIMVGDHCQLGPTIKSRNILNPVQKLSLFERLIYNGYDKSTLLYQYRMNPEIAKFSSKTFYKNKIIHQYVEDQNISHKFKNTYFKFPNPSKPVLFYSHNNYENITKNLTNSHYNSEEAAIVVELIQRLIFNGFTFDQIGVITYYNLQKKILIDMLNQHNIFRPRKENNLKDLEVASVDSFQGREKDIIIISCVRSNLANEIGFLSDPRRLNVSLTRAKHGLIIIGNSTCLKMNPLWNSLIDHYSNEKLIYTGPWTKLRLFKETDKLESLLDNL